MLKNAEKRLKQVVTSPALTISEAIARLDAAGTGALALCAPGRRLVGLLTDGDLRRAILNGTNIADPCGSISSADPVTIPTTVSAAEALELMNFHDINHLPVVDSSGRLLCFVLRRDLVPANHQLGLSAVIMAGGFGTRLLPLTRNIPKPMLPVGDRPLLERTINRLRKAGIRSVSLTTHHLADSIVSHFGDGKDFGVRLDYVREENPLGTAGGLKLVKYTKDTMLVINGDVLTRLPFEEMLNYHRTHKAVVTVGVRKHQVDIPFGVVETEGSKVLRIREKPSMTFFVNAGTYLIEPLVRDYIPDGERCDMPDLLQRLIEAGHRVVSFPILEYWLDIGQPNDYRQAQDDVRAKCV